MTCIAGFVADGKTWIGGDSAASEGAYVNTLAEPKVFFNGDFLFGCAGSFRQLQVMRHVFEPPRVPAGCPNVEAFMVKNFIPALQNCFKLQGLSGVESGSVEHSNKQSGFVVAWRDHVWEAYYDYSLLRNDDGIAVMGSGGSDARAAVVALKEYGMAPVKADEVVWAALEISSRYTSNVRSPFTILHT